MSFAEDIISLRRKVAEAVEKGVVAKEGKDFLEATLIQVLNEAERSRQSCVNQAANLRNQASMHDGQASAMSGLSAIVLNILNGYIRLADREAEERARLEDEAKSKAFEEKLEKDNSQLIVDKKKDLAKGFIKFREDDGTERLPIKGKKAKVKA